MAITYVGAGTYSASGTIPTPTLPAGVQAGDILVLFRESMNGGAAFDAVNWTEVSGSPSYANTGLNATRTALGVFWRRATGSDSSPTMNDAGNHSSVVILAFRGCVSSGDPFDTLAAAQQTTVSTTGTAPSVTTTEDNCWVLIGVTHSDNNLTTPQFSNPQNANLSNLTERSDNTTDENNGGGLAVYTGEKATAGSTGTTTVTCGVSSTMALFTLALKPAIAVNHQEDFDDSLTLDDSQTITESTAHVQGADDTLTLSDYPTGVTHEVSHSVSPSDTLALDDSVSTVHGDGHQEDVDDVLTLSDSVSTDLQAPEFSLVITHNLNLLP